MGWARVNLRLVQGRSELPYESPQESIAIHAWRKQQRIDLYRTIATVTAVVNPEKAQAALQRLIEEMFPEVGHEREGAVDKAMEIMEKERAKTYSVAAVGSSLKKTPWGRAKSIIRNRGKPGRQ